MFLNLQAPDLWSTIDSRYRFYDLSLDDPETLYPGCELVDNMIAPMKI